MSRHDGARAGLSQVNFVCQKCCQPLRIDNSLYAAQAKDLNQLSAPFTKDQVDGQKCLPRPNTSSEQFQIQGSPGKNAYSKVSRKEVVSTRVSQEGSNDFTLLGETGAGSSEILSQKVQMMSHLFDIMSDHSEVDHPLCTDCTDTLLDQLDQQLKITEDECKDYRDFLEKVSSDKDSIKEDDLDRELEQLRAEEKSLQQQLESIEADFSHLEGQVRIEQTEAKRLEEEESRYWKSYNEYKRQLLEYEDAQKSIEHQLKYAQAQLDKLKKTNVFNATFHIWHSGHFGTINNFRLGRLPSVPVDWLEINAAWGQTVLLLHSLANKMNLKFQRYRLVPYGSHSYLESLTDKSKELPLYASGGFKFFWDTKFDQAMVAFLDCLQQFKEEVERGDSSFCLPYKMEKGRIEDTSTGTSYSIKIQFNSEEQWTKALKFMLTNLKWGLAWVSSQFANK